MKEVIYKLIGPVDGVNELVLRAPTRKNLKFAAAVKSAFMEGAVTMAEKFKTSGGDNKKTRDEDDGLDGKEMLSSLYAMGADVGTLLERFILACTDSQMCHANASPVANDFWDNVSMDDMEGLFAEFLGNFITI